VNDKVYVDASQPATLQRPNGPVSYYTLQEAVLAWHKLPEKERAETTIAVNVPDLRCPTNRAAASQVKALGATFRAGRGDAGSDGLSTS
jgi:hypothetical protein